MNYKETVNWMFARLPMFQNLGASAYRKNLDNITLLAQHLGNPERNLKCIHVAGTNGKGSTSHLLASVLQEAGYRVGLYTSPHLKDFRERIRINGEEISEDYVISFITQNKSFLEAHDLSFFEMTVGLAFDYFHYMKVDVAVIEVGMGGRLDATNIITPLLSVITNIGLDHTQFLGNTLEAIAGEKAGIIKSGIPVVIGEINAQTKIVFEGTALKTQSPIYFASEIKENLPDCPLMGDYQKHNKKTVLQTIRVLQSMREFSISEKQIALGFARVLENTHLQGRWQIVQENPRVICDTAHNPDGLKIVLNQLKEQKYHELHLVLGMVQDKDLDEILPLFPTEATYYFCKPNLPRGLDESTLKETAKKFGLKGNQYRSVSDAYEAARTTAKSDDLIFVGGSTFVVGEIL